MTSCRAGEPDDRTLDRVGYLEGEHYLVLSASLGPLAGDSVFGTLTLVRRDSIGVPFYGWTDVQLDDVGAHRLGNPSSTDIVAPGVLVLTTPDPSDPARPGSVILRLGPQANRSDIIRFDGAYTALYVRWIEADAFGGDWASGMSGPEVEGEFCAVRTNSP
jgi:hypothetical protein